MDVSRFMVYQSGDGSQIRACPALPPVPGQQDLSMVCPSEERRLGTDRPAWSLHKNPKTFRGEETGHGSPSTETTDKEEIDEGHHYEWSPRNNKHGASEVDLGGGGVWSRNDQQKSGLVRSLLNTLQYPGAAGVRTPTKAWVNHRGQPTGGPKNILIFFTFLSDFSRCKCLLKFCVYIWTVVLNCRVID